MRSNILAAVALLSAATCAHAQPAVQDTSTAAGPTASTGTARPQLTAEQAKRYHYKEVLKYVGLAGAERVDPWDPLADDLANNVKFKPTYTVDAKAKANGATVFNTVQAAISRAATDNAGANKKRVYIRILPGEYKELLYVPAEAGPVTLYGEGASAADTKITARLDAAVKREDYIAQYGAHFAQAHPAVQSMHQFIKDRPNANIGTFSSATVWVKSHGFQARNLTIENGYNKDTGNAREECGERPCGRTDVNPQAGVVHHQAVALMLEGADQAQFENVRLIGFQDTLFVKSAEARNSVRSFFNKSYIEGDVDFIFGDTTAFFRQSEIKSLGDRSTAYVGAPNTNYRSKYGLVFDQCRFTNDGQGYSKAGQFYLARQWFHNQRCTPYGKVALDGYSCTLGDVSQFKAPAGTITPLVLETVGKMVVLNSTIGKHINRERPWSNWNRNGTINYRPAQFNSDDFWANLKTAGLDPVKDLGYPGPAIPADPFLAEYNNTIE